MLAKAREADPDIDWREGDLAGWEPPEPVDLLYSNAVLHWVDDHGTVLPNLLRRLRPDGVLAIQMPRNFAAPSHQAYMEIAQTPRWRTALEHLIRGEPTQPPAFYYDLLTPLTQSLDIWETEYVQVLDGENPVPDYVKGTSLKPFLDALAEPERTQFKDEYRAKVLKSYPPQSDGKTLFPFRRLFIMARL